jgi:alpha-L-fucosidase
VLNEDLSNGQHCSKFKLIYFDSNDVLSAKYINGTTIGRKRIISFPTVTINSIELMIEKQNGVTSISEIEAYLIDEKLIEK